MIKGPHPYSPLPKGKVKKQPYPMGEGIKKIKNKELFFINNIKNLNLKIKLLGWGILEYWNIGILEVR
jgi:hypothetical protein